MTAAAYNLFFCYQRPRYPVQEGMRGPDERGGAGLPGLAFTRPGKQIWPFLNWLASKFVRID